MNVSIEDYLRVMYSLFEQKKEISSVDISKLLKVSKPSVSAMMKRLEAMGFIIKEPYSKIVLTIVGKKEARKIVHKRRIIEVFLAQKLNYKTKNLDDDACMLEHAFSKKAIRKLDKFLDVPQKCPHEKDIPR